MPQLFVIRKDRNPATGDVVTQAVITEGFRRALANLHTSDVWIGPAPRITRTGGVLEPEVIRVAWLIRVSDPSAASQAAGITTANRARNIANSLDQEIEPGRWGQAVVTPYTVALNGTEEWWSSGRAARESLTADHTVPLTTERPENPIGPDDQQTRPGGAPGSGNDASSQLASALKVVTVVVVVASFAYVVGQVMPAVNLWSADRAGRRAANNEAKRIGPSTATSAPGAAPRSNPGYDEDEDEDDEPRENPRRAIDHKFAGQAFSQDRGIALSYVKGVISKGTARDALADRRRKRSGR